ncbi:hypothetical protein K493DRAFT_317280 [Basidiobolus meristosporus CBS 931.73]|uniref:Peroxisome assembly protein 22 n=1 Tax=Basidiobolus meristosporus CBS 931.73 TaxID=1314790 RepID=A0A1Y1Y0B4_9FUNG|nr:hypothetical protein K493DRAFT_317280 [Basidiobolus meristosporus CBS 931.73]|eukprot:ORX91408.1 hypothetical protein K493DRAFT_317280 [Basidiobolus meristosporus CBS 931.73]
MRLSKRFVYSGIATVVTAAVVTGAWWWYSSDSSDDESSDAEITDSLNSGGPAGHPIHKPRLTLSGNELLFDRELHILPESWKYLDKLRHQFDVYLILTVQDQEQADSIKNELQHANFFSLLDIQKLLFSQTTEGRGHMVRHIEPYIHIDSDIAIVEKVAPFIPRCIYLDQNASALVETEAVFKRNNVEHLQRLADSSLLK